MIQANERCPGGVNQSEAAETFGGVSTILAPTTLHHPKAIAPAYAVLVMRRDGQWRRQLYCSLHSAQKAMERAKANGVKARCQLVELVPVPSHPVVVVDGGGLDG